MQHFRSARNGNGEESRIQQKEKSEKKPEAVSVSGDGRHIQREEQREQRAQICRLPVQGYPALSGLIPLTQRKCRKCQNREDQEYPERNGQLRCREKFHHPSPLVEDGKNKAEQS